MLRHDSDWRTMLWAFVFFPAVGIATYAEPRAIPWLLPFTLYFGFCAGVFSHNHNHCPTFKSRRLNELYSAWLSIFYLFPTFMWVPTHNLNHHKYVNKAGDATITWRYSKKHTWLVASTYYFVSVYWQMAPINEYIQKAAATNRRLFDQIRFQYATVFAAHGALLALAIGLRGPTMGPIVYGFGFLMPALFANWSMIFINYIQHVHTDPWSEHNHSRNFCSPFQNWFVFNNGLHGAHHEAAGVHWSKLPEVHAKIAHLIHPDLKQSSIFGFCFKSYFLGAFSERFRTRQVGRAPYDPPGGLPMKIETAAVSAVEVGVNASMA